MALQNWSAAWEPGPAIDAEDSARPCREEPRLVAAGVAALDRMASGMVLLGAGGDVAFMNAGAQEMIERGDGLVLRGRSHESPGRLGAAAARDDARLRVELAYVKDHRDPGTRAIAISRRTGARPYVVQLASVTGFLDSHWAGPRIVAVAFVTDPDVACRIREDVFRSAFGTTRAEARLACALLNSETLEQAARRMGVAVSTLRSHLRALFMKTGTRRQAELVGLLSALAVVRP